MALPIMGGSEGDPGWVLGSPRQPAAAAAEADGGQQTAAGDRRLGVAAQGWRSERCVMPGASG